MDNLQNLDEYRTPKDFRGKSRFAVQLWWLVQAILFRPSPQIMYGWRRFLLRLFGAKIGKKVLVRPTVRVTYPWKLSIGDYSWIGDNVVLYTLGQIDIGNHTVISQRSYICTGSHDYNSKNFDIFSMPIIIGNKCWLATDVYVAPSIRIGNCTVVGARSSVFEDLPENMICVGSPAKPIKERKKLEK